MNNIRGRQASAKIRFRFASVAWKEIEGMINKIKDKISSLDVKMTAVAAPKKTKVMCILKSPHVYSKHKRHYAIDLHRQILHISIFNNDDMSKVLSKLNTVKPVPGVDIEKFDISKIK